MGILKKTYEYLRKSLKIGDEIFANTGISSVSGTSVFKKAIVTNIRQNGKDLDKVFWVDRTNGKCEMSDDNILIYFKELKSRRNSAWVFTDLLIKKPSEMDNGNS